MQGKIFGPGLGMTRGAIIAVFLFLFVWPLAHASAQEEEEEENVCVSCHLDMEDILLQVVLDWQQSVHAEAGVFCQDCHGGDPTDYGEAMEPSTGFMGKPAKPDIPMLCAKCHSDRAKMRAYSLPANQFARYGRSVHGKALLQKKNENAPSCVDCHGLHKIKRVADPQSTVHRKNIVKTCAKCHSNKKIMKSSGLPANQYELYKDSLHGELYFAGDLGVPTCISCHSNHDIKKPQTLTVRLVCVNCHVDQEEWYRKSGHWAAAQETGKPVCIHCHSNHSIAKPSIAKFKEPGPRNCLDCHDRNSLQMEKANAIYLLEKATEEYMKLGEEADIRINEWSGNGFETSHLELKVKKIKSILKEMRVMSHSLDTELLLEKAKIAQKLSTQVTEEVNFMTDELIRRRWGLVATWTVFLCFSAALVIRARHGKRTD